MRIFDHLVDSPSRLGDDLGCEVELSFSDRQRSRLRVSLGCGGAVGISVPRGTILRDGQWLGSSDEHLLQVRAAPESVSIVHASEPLGLARAAYHLGNRHVWVQLGSDWLCYLADPVLDQMLVQLGYDVSHGEQPFEPEAGAYASHGHAHGH
ncbi:MAG: urease accessory protein UreE [Pseudomonadota bacterium]